MKTKLKTKIKETPSKSGVYLFKNQRGKIIYIGKAKNLRQRIKSHFQKKSTDFLNFSPKVVDFDFIITENEKEALFLENELIKKHQPRYNIELKDDKNYFYVVIEKSDWPRVSLTHQPSKLSKKDCKILGPFVSGRELKKYLSNIRKIIPFRSCRNISKKPCLYYHLGLCPAPCLEKIKTSKIKQKQYLLSLVVLEELLKIYQLRSGRVEMYDISHISGKFMVGAMVVFEKNKPKKSEYRLFKIKTLSQANDPKALKEIISRRLKHQKWKKPNLIILDGGKAQLNSVKSFSLPAIALSKDKKHQISKILTPFSKKALSVKALPKETQSFLFQIQEEAHRFAIKYHKLKRKKSLFA